MEPARVTNISHSPNLFEQLSACKTTDQLIHLFTILPSFRYEFNVLHETQFIDLTREAASKGLSNEQKNLLFKVSQEAQKILGTRHFGTIHQEVLAACNFTQYYISYERDIAKTIRAGIAAQDEQLLKSCCEFIKRQFQLHINITTKPETCAKIAYFEAHTHFPNFLEIWTLLLDVLPKHWECEYYGNPTHETPFFRDFGSIVNHLHIIAPRTNTQLANLDSLLRLCPNVEKLTLNAFSMDGELIAALEEHPTHMVEISTDFIPHEHLTCISHFIEKSIQNNRKLAISTKPMVTCDGDDEPFFGSVATSDEIPLEFIRKHSQGFLEYMLRCERFERAERQKQGFDSGRNHSRLVCEHAELADLLFPVFLNNLIDPLFSEGIDTYFQIVEKVSTVCWQHTIVKYGINVHNEPLNNHNFLKRFLTVLFLHRTPQGVDCPHINESMLVCREYMKVNYGFDLSEDSSVVIYPYLDKEAARLILSRVEPFLYNSDIVFNHSPTTKDFLDAHRIFASLIVEITLTAKIKLNGPELTELIQSCSHAKNLKISSFLLNEEHLEALCREELNIFFISGCQPQSLAVALRAAFREPTIRIDSEAIDFREALKYLPIAEIIHYYDLLEERFKINQQDFINYSSVGLVLATAVDMKKRWVQDLCVNYLQRNYKLSLNIHDGKLDIFSIDWERIPLEVFKDIIGIMSSVIVHLDLVDKEKSRHLFSIIGSKVTYLNFKKSDVTDDSLTAIVELCPNLEKLGIHALVTNKGLSVLSTLKQLHQLQLFCPNVTHLPAFTNRMNVILYPQDNFDFTSIFLSNVHSMQIFDCSLNDLTPFENAGSAIILLQNVMLSDAAMRQACKLKIANGIDLRGLSIDLIPIQIVESVILEIDEQILENHILQIVDPDLLVRFKRQHRSPALLKLLPIFAKKCPKEYAAQYWKENFQEFIKSLFPPSIPENLPMHPVKCVTEPGPLLKVLSATSKTLVEPYTVLAALRDHKTIKNLYIIFVDSVGIDQSGLCRQFITQLFEGLTQHSSTHLKFVRHEQEGFIPELSQNPDAKTVAYLETIGRIMAFSAHHNRKFPIGEIFHPLFYQVLMKLEESDLSVLPFNRLMALYGILHQNSHEYQQFKSLLGLNPGALLSADQQNFLDALWIEHSNIITDDLRNDIRDHFTSLLNAHILPIQAIARGIHQSLPFQIRGMRVSRWNQYFNQEYSNHIDFKIQVEGELTKELFLQKVNICVYNLPDIPLSEEEKEIQNEEIARFRSWIEEWVACHSIEELRNVLLAITSARNLSVNIQFRLIETDGINAHTCFGTVDIHRFFTKEEFLREMDDWAAGKGIRTISRS